MTPTFRRPWRSSLLTAAIVCLAFACSARAEDAPAPPPAAPPAPTEPAAPPPAPAEQPKRKEEEGEPKLDEHANPSSLGVRVSAALKALQGQGAVVSQLADRETQIAALTRDRDALQSQLRDRDATITSLRAEHQQIENAMRGLEAKERNVNDALAGLGFPQNQLPSTATIEQAAENSIEGLQEQMKNEQSPTKRGEIAARIIALSRAQK